MILAVGGGPTQRIYLDQGVLICLICGGYMSFQGPAQRQAATLP